MTAAGYTSVPELRIVKLLLVCIVGIAVWGSFTVYLALKGVWMTSIVPEGDIESFYDWAVSEISSKNQGNSALVLIQNGEFAKQYFAGAQESVDEDTLFPTASFSKWVTTMGVMSLVEDNLIDLDSPVARYLTRWQLPDTGFNNDEVTVRRLLSHTAGLVDKLGFGDYQLQEEIPSLEDELRRPRASSGKDVVISVGNATIYVR